MSVRLGLMSDIHGNPVALDVVIADGPTAGVEAWWVLGDLVAIGLSPVSTAERLAKLELVRFVRGNTDRYVVSGRPSAAPPCRRRTRSGYRLHTETAMESGGRANADHPAELVVGSVGDETLPRSRRPPLTSTNRSNPLRSRFGDLVS